MKKCNKVQRKSNVDFQQKNNSLKEILLKKKLVFK